MRGTEIVISELFRAVSEETEIFISRLGRDMNSIEVSALP